MSSDVTHIITIKINTFPVLFPWVRDAALDLDKIWTKYPINIHNLIHTWKMIRRRYSGIVEYL